MSAQPCIVPFDTLKCYQTLVSGGIEHEQAKAITYAFRDACIEMLTAKVAKIGETDERKKS